MPAFDSATLDRWRALAIVDRDGTTVGTISEFYLDRETGQPTWALVNMGLFGTRQTFVPLLHANEISDGLQVPYEKEHIRDAPPVDLHDELTPAEEASLAAHYGIDYRPAAEPTPPEPTPEPGETASGSGSLAPPYPSEAAPPTSRPHLPPAAAASPTPGEPGVVAPELTQPQRAADDPDLAAAGPGPVPATDEAARTAGIPAAPTGASEGPAGEPPPLTGAGRLTEPPGDAGWAPGEAAGFERHEPMNWSAGTGASDLRRHEAEEAEEAGDHAEAGEEQSPLDRAKRRLERLVSGSAAPPSEQDEVTPEQRETAERARRERLGIDERELRDR
jgi:hypothetical protein